MAQTTHREWILDELRDRMSRGNAPERSAEILDWATGLADGALNAIGECFGADIDALAAIFKDDSLRAKLSGVVGSDRRARLLVQEDVQEFRDNWS